MSFQRYPAYRDSGVEWLGEVPAHWEVRRLKHIADVFPSNVDKKAYEDQEEVNLCNYVDVYYNEEITSDLEFMKATATSEQISRFALRAGDIIITKDSEAADDIAISAYVPRDLPGVICGYHLSMVRPGGGMHGRFIKRLFDSRFLKAQFEVAARGLTRVGLPQYAIDNVLVPVPSEMEQRLIATFLDRETARIDALVTEQEKLIDLLKEKRQAVISRAVTKGLDPQVPMKDSGIAWLGEVPAHWDVMRLKFMSSEITVGIVVEPSKYYSLEGGVPALRSLNVRSGKIVLDNLVYISDESNDVLKKSRLRKGDLVVVRSGQPGTTAIIPEELDGCNCIDLIIIRKPEKDSEKFLCWYLASDPAVSQFSEGAGGAIQQHFNIGMAVDLVIPRPDLAEQYAIVCHLEMETRRIDTLILESQKAITLLKERRAALISAAVTGRIDVRDRVAAGATEAA